MEHARTGLLLEVTSQHDVLVQETFSYLCVREARGTEDSRHMSCLVSFRIFFLFVCLRLPCLSYSTKPFPLTEYAFYTDDIRYTSRAYNLGSFDIALWDSGI
jgi:hypothetical protein